MNPHEIAPASTSKYLTGFPGVACSCVVNSLETSELPRISLFFANTLTKPLTVLARANDPYGALRAVKRCQLGIACREMYRSHAYRARPLSVRRDFEQVLLAMQRTTDRQRTLPAHGALVSSERLPIEVR